MSVTSRTKNESHDGSHGSIFTVQIPLGRDHLPPTHVHDTMSEEHRHQHYARGIVEEATHWLDPSDVQNSRTATSSPTSIEGSDTVNEVNKLDHSTLFFVKTDILLLGE